MAAPLEGLGYHPLEIHGNPEHILAMTTAPKSSSPKLVRESRSGELREVRGFGALKGQLKITKGASELLVAALQSSPFRDVDIEPRRDPMPVRDITCDGLAGQMDTAT